MLSWIRSLNSSTPSAAWWALWEIMVIRIGSIIKLEQFGHRLLAHFHSHPGNGIEANRPSGTNTGFQKRLEDAGYPAVAAIFSRDGYVRFFRLDDDLEIEIYGSGVEQHD